MTHNEIIEAIRTLRPGAEWTLRGASYEGLEWLDQVQSKPTAQDLGL